MKRRYAGPDAYSRAVKAAKTLGLEHGGTTALGTWRSLLPINGEYVDYEGPFNVQKRAGPAFVRDDGVEVFMYSVDACVEVVLEDPC